MKESIQLMTFPQWPVRQLKEYIEQASAITLLTHINPDADTLGTGLGIYNLLKSDQNRKIEIVNVSKALPQYLDFLPGYKKIKKRPDFEDSLIISCDCGSADRLGIDISGREVINVDHHASNERYGTLNIVDSHAASASQVAYRLFKGLYAMNLESATCFYAALFSDTQYFTTSSVNQEVFEVAKEWVDFGVKPNEVAYHFTQRHSLASLRILERALSHLQLHRQGHIASLYVTQKEIRETGAEMPDMEGIVDYAKSLATVEIGIFAMELPQGIRISLRSKGADVSRVAKAFGGGGHKVAAGFTLEKSKIDESIDTILQKIQELGIMNEAQKTEK